MTAQLKNDRRPKNEAEGTFHDAATAAGWEVSKRGWPDFFMWRDGKIACVEVKPKGDRKLKPEQTLILRELAAYGVPCYRWAPDAGFVRIYDQIATSA